MATFYDNRERARLALEAIQGAGPAGSKDRLDRMEIIVAALRREGEIRERVRMRPVIDRVWNTACAKNATDCDDVGEALVLCESGEGQMAAMRCAGVCRGNMR